MSENFLTIKTRLDDALSRFEVSQNKAAKEMGFTGSVLSQYRSGTYQGDIDKVEEAIIKWIARRTERAGKKHVPVVETTTLKQMTRAIRLAHDEKDIALLVGDAGSGKSVSSEMYKEENSRTTVLVKCSGATNKKIMTQDIAEQLGLETYRVGFDKLIRQVSRVLREKEAVVIIDEADFLKSDALEFSRRLVNDLGESGLVLIGLPSLVWTIQNLKNDHRQLESRIGVFLKVDGLTKADAKKITETLWDNIDKDVVEAAYEISGKDTRQFVKILNRAQNIMTANKMTVPDLETIEMAGSMILRRPYQNKGGR